MNTRLMAAFVLTAALALPALAQRAAPDTPAGQTVAGWIEAVNSGDREKMRAFHLAHSRGTDEDRERAERHAGMDAALFKRSGGVDLARIVTSIPHIPFTRSRPAPPPTARPSPSGSRSPPSRRTSSRRA
jgi:hypothetical protein